MTRTVEPADFAAAVNDILKEYGDHAREALNEAIPEVAERANQDLHTAGTFEGRKYRGSWSTKVEMTRLGVDAVVYNRRHYRLTSLLEFGHAKQNGGRTRAFPHIAPINDRVESEVMEEFEKRL